MTDYASVEAVAQAAKEWSDANIACRVYRHQWQPEAAVWNPLYRFYSTSQVCPRCRLRKWAELSERGHVIASGTDYSETSDYLLKGVGRIAGDGLDALRLEGMARTFKVQTLRANGAAAKALPRSAKTRAELGLDGASGAE